MREKWYESDNPTRVARGGAWRIGAFIVVGILFFGAISIAMWTFGVFTSDIKGQGDAIRQKNTATNRIAAQERFEDLHQEIVAADQKIDLFADALKRDPDSQVAQTNLNGAIAYCVDTVADYNAEARKFTSQEFRAADLPYQIDQTSPKTDCEESK
jgi:hypothetical protein